jgi:hypothetical protein
VHRVGLGRPVVDHRLTHVLAEQTVREPGEQVRAGVADVCVVVIVLHPLHALDALDPRLGLEARLVHVLPLTVDILRSDDAPGPEPFGGVAPAVRELVADDRGEADDLVQLLGKIGRHAYHEAGDRVGALEVLVLDRAGVLDVQKALAGRGRHETRREDSGEHLDS